MERKVGENAHYDELLKTSLHCDDKEKLRRRLVLLQKEYLRTARRLKRAERLEAARKHVRNKITEQNHQNQRGSGDTSSPLLQRPSSSRAPDAVAETATALSERRSLNGDPADNSRRSQTIKFLLPSEAACTPPADASLDPARSHRASPALRLRSRRSRLRWERRSTEASRSADNSEDGLEQVERMEGARREGEEGKAETEGTEVVDESEEMAPASESESPSLLLTHWSTGGGAGETDAREKEGGQRHQEEESGLADEVKRDSGSASLLRTRWSPATNTEGGQMRESPCEENRNEKTEQQQNVETAQIHDSTLKIKEDKDAAGKGLTDSCTVVEGLLYPAEYYIRTTRRMTFAQSQPDVQAVILSQFSQGRGLRRGRGRGSSTNGCSDRRTQTDSSSLSESTSSGSRVHFGVQAVDATDAEAPLSSAAGTARPVRSRRRGRGRGTSLTVPRSSRSETPHPGPKQTSGDSQPISCAVGSSRSPRGAEGAETEAAAPVPDDPQPPSRRATHTQNSSGVNGAPSSTTSGHLKDIHPIFLQRSCRTTRSTQMTRTSWQSLRLPSSSPTQNSLLPSPSLLPASLLHKLVNFDIQQDFHLPDDQFASLKLHKLRQVAVELEHFTSPSYNTRSSRHADARRRGSGDAAAPLPFTLSPSPTVQNPTQESLDRQSWITLSQTSAGCKVGPDSMSQSSGERLSHGDAAETAEEKRHEGIDTKCQALTSSARSVPAVPECVDGSVAQYKEPDPQSSHVDGSLDASVTLQPDLSCTVQRSQQSAERLTESVDGRSDVQPASDISEQQADCPGSLCPVEDQLPTYHQTEGGAVAETLSYSDCPPEDNSAASAVKTCNDSEGHLENPVIPPKCLAEERPEPSAGPPTDDLAENKSEDKPSPRRGVHSELLLSPSITPHPVSPALPCSPRLPSLGLTPRPVTALTSPPPHKSSTPPAHSPCPSPASILPTLPPGSPPGPVQGFSEPPAPCPTVPTIQSHRTNDQQCAAREAGIGHVETAQEHMRPTQTLKAPAGGSLVDACCLLGSSGALYVAAAGKWAVCVWSQTSASDWSLIHTWTFNKPVINVFSVPGAADLMYVTLGQLEIREVRMLSCSSLSDVLLCEGVVQAVVGVSKSRVVSSSHSSPGSALQVFTLSDSSSVHGSEPLVSPGVCVRALAPVDGLSDALIGTDEAGRVFVWNLKSGQLLRRIVLGDGLPHSACLRGYSCSGVLFVLLQHHFLSSLEEELDAKGTEESLSQEDRQQEQKKSALFSLIAVNPLNGKSVLATRLYPHKSWTGRLCEADVCGSGVVGLSQSGCVCTWDVGGRGGARAVRPTDRDGWLLARWGEPDTLVTGHHNGDVTLHRVSAPLTKPLV